MECRRPESKNYLHWWRNACSRATHRMHIMIMVASWFLFLSTEDQRRESWPTNASEPALYWSWHVMSLIKKYQSHARLYLIGCLSFFLLATPPPSNTEEIAFPAAANKECIQKRRHHPLFILFMPIAHSLLSTKASLPLHTSYLTLWLTGRRCTVGRVVNKVTIHVIFWQWQEFILWKSRSISCTASSSACIAIRLWIALLVSKNSTQNIYTLISPRRSTRAFSWSRVLRENSWRILVANFIRTTPMQMPKIDLQLWSSTYRKVISFSTILLQA